MRIMVIYGKTQRGELIFMEKRLKIVVADDSSQLGESCAKTFRAYGMNVILCQKDGLKVLEIIKKERDYSPSFN